MILPDVQKTKEGFKKISIKKVGMRNIELPIKIYSSFFNEGYETKAIFSSYCNLVNNVKGINMSRITRTLITTLRDNDFSQEKDLFRMMNLFQVNLQNQHSTDNIYTKVVFDYPVARVSPITELDSPDYVTLSLESVLQGSDFRNYLRVSRVGMSLCPCSKEMSLLKNNITSDETAEINKLSPKLREKVLKAGFGAHNQRSHIDLTLEVLDFKNLNLVDLISDMDRSYSCSVKTVLKRPDEKYETEVSYLGGFFDKDGIYQEVEGSGPKFVEDIARDMAYILDTNYLDKSIDDYCIVVNNDESIHSGNIEATAVLTAGRNLI